SRYTYIKILLRITFQVSRKNTVIHLT
ncbi:unnamed protein product, partial [Allacma fusca]